MARNRRYNNQSPIWSWVSFIVFGFLIVLFGTSIWHRKSPAKVLKSWVTSAPSDDPIYNMSKKELRAYVKDQQIKMDSIAEKLEVFQESVRSSVGIINTETASLNMRSAPSLNSDIIIKIPNSTAVNILHYDTEEYVLEGKKGSWCRVQYNDKVGWVWGNYLLVNH